MERSNVVASWKLLQVVYLMTHEIESVLSGKPSRILAGSKVLCSKNLINNASLVKRGGPRLEIHIWHMMNLTVGFRARRKGERRRRAECVFHFEICFVCMNRWCRYLDQGNGVLSYMFSRFGHGEKEDMNFVNNIARRRREQGAWFPIFLVDFRDFQSFKERIGGGAMWVLEKEVEEHWESFSKTLGGGRWGSRRRLIEFSILINKKDFLKLCIFNFVSSISITPPKFSVSHLPHSL